MFALAGAVLTAFPLTSAGEDSLLKTPVAPNTLKMMAKHRILAPVRTITRRLPGVRITERKAFLFQLL